VVSNILSYNIYVYAFSVRCCNVHYNYRIKQYSVRLYLQLVVGGLMTYAICVCVCIAMSSRFRLSDYHGGCLIRDRDCLPFASRLLVESVLLIVLVFCVVLLLVFFLCWPNVTSFSGLSIHFIFSIFSNIYESLICDMVTILVWSS
jgi:hypothetical protein